MVGRNNFLKLQLIPPSVQQNYCLGFSCRCHEEHFTQDDLGPFLFTHLDNIQLCFLNTSVVTSVWNMQSWKLKDEQLIIFYVLLSVKINNQIRPNIYYHHQTIIRTGQNSCTFIWSTVEVKHAHFAWGLLFSRLWELLGTVVSDVTLAVLFTTPCCLYICVLDIILSFKVHCICWTGHVFKPG